MVGQRQEHEQDNDRVALSNACVFSDMKHRSRTWILTVNPSLVVAAAAATLQFERGSIDSLVFIGLELGP